MSSPEPSSNRGAAAALLRAACAGDEQASRDLAPLLYGELKRVAHSLLDGERTGHTLQATALVHEAWVRLVDVDILGTSDAHEARRRFVALAAHAMRNVLIDHARRKNAEKRGGARQRVTLHEALPVVPIDGDALLDLHAALEKLSALDERLGRIAELRLFGGLSVAELAPVVGLALSRAKEEWAFARALLAKFLDEGQ